MTLMSVEGGLRGVFAGIMSNASMQSTSRKLYANEFFLGMQIVLKSHREFRSQRDVRMSETQVQVSNTLSSQMGYNLYFLFPCLVFGGNTP